MITRKVTVVLELTIIPNDDIAASEVDKEIKDTKHDVIGDIERSSLGKIYGLAIVEAKVKSYSIKL